MIQSRNKAILFMIISTLSFAIMGAAVKGLSNVPVIEKVMVRNLISLLVAGFLAFKTGVPLFGSSKKGRLLLAARSTFGVIGVSLIFYTTTKLPLADSALFMRLSPFWVTILAAIFLQEKITPYKIVALIFALAGTLFIMRPQNLFTALQTGTNFNLILPLIAGLVASVFAASAYTIVSKLKSYEQPETIVFVFSLFSVTCTLPFALKVGYVPSLPEIGGLIIIGLAAASGQMFLTYAYRLGKASEISIFNYVGVLFSVGIGYFFWQETPNWGTIVGGSLIVLAGFIVYYFGNKETIS